MLVVPIYCTAKESTVIQPFNLSFYPVTYPSTDLPTHLFTYLPSAYGPAHIATRPSISLALHLYIHPLTCPSIHLSFLHAVLPTRGWIDSTHVTEINEVGFLCFQRHSYPTKRETNGYIVNTDLRWNVQGVTKLDKVIDNLPGSHGDFTKEVTLRPEREESL